MDALWRRSATDLSRALLAGEVSAREVLGGASRTDRRDEPVDQRDRHAGARACDGAGRRRRTRPSLAASPSARCTGCRSHTRTSPTPPGSGRRTARRSTRTMSPIGDEPFVSRVRDAGAILLGKTNTPEFGAGSHTFNPVFGPTRNPWDPSRSAGGSSGGAAAALASGMVPIADGSDLGGSLRNPAGFCNVVGFRPSLGLVPSEPELDPEDLSVEGPMARTVEDAALLLSVMAGRPDLAMAAGAGGGPRRAARRLGPRLRRRDARRTRGGLDHRCGAAPIRAARLPRGARLSRPHGRARGVLHAAGRGLRDGLRTAARGSPR